MSKHAAKPDAQVDADGLVVQKYKSIVLVVVPPTEFGDESLRYARSSLYNVHIGTKAVSTDDNELIKGRHQDEFLPEGLLRESRMAEHSGVIFVGGEGARLYFDDPDVLRIAREAAEQKKMIGAWGHASEILARAGIVRGKKLTGDASTRAAIERAGGKFTGRQLEIDGVLVTATDDAVGMRFGKALAAIVGV